MRRVAWLHCFAGISGDMTLGALVDAGAPVDEVRTMIRQLPLSGWDVRIEPVLRGGLRGSQAIVEVTDPSGRRTYREIAAMIDEAGLPERVKRRATNAFGSLAKVEGRLHDVTPETVHFHEVGGHDAIIDIVGVASALEILGVDDVVVSPIAVGTGHVATAHGLLPNPAPATVELLVKFESYGRAIDVELTTPTGAALVSTLARSGGEMPRMVVERSGFGAGTAEIEGLPNLLHVVIGQCDDDSPGGIPLTVVETNLDDVTGEQLGRAIEMLLEIGAHDAWVTPAVMKKGRPAHVLHALCDPAKTDAIRHVMVETTGTMGVRSHSVERWSATRRETEVDVGGTPVGVKVAAHRAKAQFDDVTRAAEAEARRLLES